MHNQQTGEYLINGLVWLAGGALVDLASKIGQSGASGVPIERLVLVWPEDVGKELGEDAAKGKVGVSDGCVAALAVAHRPRMRASRLRPNLDSLGLLKAS